MLLLLALGWQWGQGLLAWIGGILLGAALLSGLLQAWKGRSKRRRTQQRVLELDWKVIDNSLAQPRPMRDCERPETLGTCTGRECLVYDSCQFNIKKPLP